MKSPPKTRPDIHAARRKSHVHAGTITKANFENGFATDVFFGGSDELEVLVRGFPFGVDPVTGGMWRCF